jgi:hypothetical protein
MFTLSEKQRVINTPDSVRVFSAANVERTTSAAVAATDKLFIEGFGHFDLASISDIKLRRGRAAVLESKEFTVTAPVGVAIGDAIELSVEVATTRYQSELNVASRLGQSRTFNFVTKPLAAVTAAAIRTALVQAYTDFAAEFSMGDLAFEVTAGTAAADIRITALSGYESISFKRVAIRRSNQGIGSQSFVALALNVTIAEGFEGEGLGKFLEESIRMATPGNNDPYGVDNADTRVDLRGTYTALTFTVSTTYQENLSTLAADHGPLPATHKFVLYLNEATCMAANSAVAKLAAAAILRAAALSSLTATVTAAPLTLAEEKSEVLILANGSSVATSAAFIA